MAVKMTEEPKIRARREYPDKMHFPAAVYDEARRLYNEDPRPGWVAMAATLASQRKADPKALGYLADDPRGTPTADVLRSWPKAGLLWESDGLEPWRFADDPDDAYLILPVARLVTGELPLRRLARSEAGWVARIRRAVPDLDDLWQVYYLARLMEHEPDAVQMYLTYAPWRDEGPEPLKEALVHAVKSGAMTIETVYRLGFGAEVQPLLDPHHPRNRRRDKEGAKQ
jgi:hypothetical protein